MKAFLRSLNQFISENVIYNHKISNWVVIHSRPGCQDQAAHCDYIPDLPLAAASDEQMPLSAIVALMPDTRLNIWPGSIKISTLNSRLIEHVKPIQKTIVKLNSGDMLIFRGDLVYAGSSYEKDNYRLHAFLDSPHVSRKRNRTWTITDHTEDEIQRVIVTS